MLYDFNDHLILYHRGLWFLWETAWDSFRPIDDIQWSGERFVIRDRTYCSDLSDPLYGYGSEAMKDLCELLGDRRHDLPESVTCLPIGTREWFMDRPVSITPCAPRDRASWKRMAGSHPRTLRRLRPAKPCGRTFTRRSWE
jgi:hypothetical protein